MRAEIHMSNVTPADAVAHFAKAGVPGYAYAVEGYSTEYGYERGFVFVHVADSQDSLHKLEFAADDLALARGEKEYLATGFSHAETMLVRRHRNTGPPDPKTGRATWATGDPVTEHLDVPRCPRCGERHPNEVTPELEQTLRQVIEMLKQPGEGPDALPYGGEKVDPKKLN